MSAQEANKGGKKQKWVPLEANPDVLNRFASKLGMDTSKVSFCDVWGLDEDVLAFVPQPVHAVVLLFPVSEALDAEAKKVDDELEQTGLQHDPNVFYMKQTIGNACGTIGLLHAVGNNQHVANIRTDSFFAKFFEATATMGPVERGAYLEHPPNDAVSLESAHAEAAQQGDTAPEVDVDVTPHFITLINHNGRLLELDGRKRFVVDHGQTSASNLLQDSAVVARQFMDKCQSINFNLMAFTKTPEE